MHTNQAQNSYLQKEREHYLNLSRFVIYLHFFPEKIGLLSYAIKLLAILHAYATLVVFDTITAKTKQGNRRSHFARARTPITPFPADPICSERGSDGMIPSAA